MYLFFWYNNYAQNQERKDWDFNLAKINENSHWHSYTFSRNGTRLGTCLFYETDIKR